MSETRDTFLHPRRFTHRVGPGVRNDLVSLSNRTPNGCCFVVLVKAAVIVSVHGERGRGVVGFERVKELRQVRVSAIVK